MPKAMAAIHALCSLQLHADTLVPAVLEALHGLVPSCRNLFDWTDEHGRLLRYYIEGPIDTAIAQLYFDEFHNRREAEAMPRFDTLAWHPRGIRSAQELDHPAFFRSALYNEIWRPQGLHTRLEAVVRSPAGRLLGSLVLYRGPGQPRFTLKDERHLAAVLPTLGLALQHGGAPATGCPVGRPTLPAGATSAVAAPVAEGCARAQADQRLVPCADALETVLMDLQGQVCHASAGAQRLLLLANGGATRHTLAQALPQLAGGLLQGLLLPLSAQARAVASGGLQPGKAPAAVTLTHASTSGPLRATGVMLWAAQAGLAPWAQVSLQQLEPYCVALERALRALPITAGQMAVCRHLLQGHTQAQIAQALGVATATVVDHVRKLYRALDVHSALELRALLEARITSPPTLSSTRLATHPEQHQKTHHTTRQASRQPG